MSVGRYALGVVALLLVVGSLGLAGVGLRRRFFPSWTGALARLAEVVIGLGLLILTLELLGAIGLFRLGFVVAVGAVMGVGVWRTSGVRGRDRFLARAVPPAPTGRTLPLTLVALLASAAVVADWAAPTIQSYNVGILSFDSLWYHLPWAALFAQTGQITGLRFTDVEYLTQFYPAGSELLHGLGIVLLGRDSLSPGLNLLWLGLVLLAGYCVGRPFGAAPVTTVAAALVMALPMFSSSQGGTAANDVVGVFFLLAAVAFLVACDWDAPALVLAAVAAGLAAGVKLSLLAPVAALTVGVVAFARGGRRRRIFALWLGSVVLAGGFWYVRNLIAVGNPLPWFSFGGLLPTPAAALQHGTAFTVAHYLGGTGLWTRVFEPALVSGLGPWWPVVLAIAVLGPVLCLVPGRGGPPERMVRMLGLVALASLFAYLVTPETAAGPRGDPLGFAFNLRYGAPALALCLTVTPLAPVFDGERRRTGLLLVFVAVLIATLAQGRLWPSRNLGGAIGVGVVVGVAVLLVLLWRPRGRAAIAGVAVLALAFALAGYPWQRHYLHGRYTFHPGISQLASVWAVFRGVHDARVGLVGTYGGFFGYPLYGLDDSNRVQYVAHRGPHGSFVPISSCRAWRVAVDAGHFSYVVTTPARNPWDPPHLGPSPEGAWTASSPSARIVYRRLAAGQLVTVFQLSGELDPAGCRES